jgi:hypothetical protein
MAFSNPRSILRVLNLPRFALEFLRYRSAAQGTRENVRIRDTYPCVADRVFQTPFDPHYFYQSAWLARRLSADKPQVHVDIGSSVMTIAVLSGFVNTTFVDYRPLEVSLPGLECRAGDITRLSFGSGSLDSVSALHVVEHIGLGRYGDPIDPEGSIKAATELQRVLKSGGSLYVSTPVGRERVCFNAHRVFSPATVCMMFSGLRLISFASVDDGGGFGEDRAPESAAGYEYGCGMFHFRKT